MIVWNWLRYCKIEEALALQEELFLKKLEGDTRNYLLFTEHFPVYSCDETHYSEELWRKPRDPKIPLHMVRRGGSINFHGPGQLLCYCIFNLSQLGIDGIPGINAAIDGVIKLFLHEHEVRGRRRSKPVQAQGIWVIGRDHKMRKIASRGLSIRQGITRFGFALNIHTNLLFYDYIYPCGLDIEMTSVFKETAKINEQGKIVDPGKFLVLPGVAQDLAPYFQEVLGVPIERDIEVQLPPLAPA